ncbi:MAG: DUF2304 domain-containing protein [Proteobacteria bacterium]|nr:DUF2304 domain-containing protein [Pseudomonadota bacterium]
MNSIQITAAVIGIVLAGTILLLVRRTHLHGSYALWWFAVAGAILVLGIFPPAIDWLGHVTGIHYPPVIPIIIGIGLILVRLLTMDIGRSRNERQLRRLTQKLAILEQELAQLRRDKPRKFSGKGATVIPLPKSGDG